MLGALVPVILRSPHLVFKATGCPMRRLEGAWVGLRPCRWSGVHEGAHLGHSLREVCL